MSKLISDKDVKSGRNTSTPSYVAVDSSSQIITSTWSDLNITPQEGDFINDEFDFDVWMNDRIIPETEQEENKDYHFRVDLAVQTPLLLPKQLHIRMLPVLTEGDVEQFPFGMLTLDIDAVLLLTINASNPYNAMYQLSPFFVQPTQYYKLQAKTNVGSISLTRRSISITRNS